jgi:hypothetical protein
MLNESLNGQSHVSPMTRSRPESDGVRLAVNLHQSTLGGYRLRFNFSAEIAAILARGLAHPRLHLSGTCVNGFRVWCAEHGGYEPIHHKRGRSWTMTLPIRKVRGREAAISSRPLDYSWERDETGPVLVIERVPDIFLPEQVLTTLPDRAVDPETRAERVDHKLRAAMARTKEESPVGVAPEPEPEPSSLGLGDAPDVEPQDPPPDSPWGGRHDEGAPRADSLGRGAPHHEAPLGLSPIPDESEPVSNEIVELQAAIGLVNELKIKLGENICLLIDDEGRLHARRRVISYIDL